MFRYKQWSLRDKIIWWTMLVVFSGLLLLSIQSSELRFDPIFVLTAGCFLGSIIFLILIFDRKVAERINIEKIMQCPEGSIHGYHGTAVVKYFPKNETATHYDISFRCWKCNAETTIRLPLDEVIPQNLRRNY